MKKRYTLLPLLFILISAAAFSQLKLKVVVEKIKVVSTVICDSPDNSDFLFEYKASDNSPMLYSNNSPVLGSIGLCNYAIVNENNGPFLLTPSAPATAVFSPANGVFFDRSYTCKKDVPSVISISWRGYENDDVTVPSITPVASGVTAISTHTIGITLQTPIVYSNTYTMTSTDGGCPQTYEITISVILSYGTFVPLFIDHVHETIICPSVSTGTLEGHPIGGSGVVVNDWSYDGLGDYDDPLLISGLSAGTYTFVSKDALNCTDTMIARISTENPPPFITAFDVSTSNVCSGQTNVLYSVPTSTNLIYYWNYAGNGTTHSNNPNNKYVLNFSNSATNGTISVYSQNSCSVSPTFTMLINVTPTPSMSLSGNPSVCQNVPQTISVFGATSYVWNTGAVTSSITVSPANTTTYAVVGSNGSCTDTKQFVLTVLPSPTVNINGPITAGCAGQTVTLASSGSGSLFLWSDGFSGANHTVSPTSTTIYTVTNILNSCVTQATYTLNVNATPTINVSGNSLVCPGKTLTLTATGTNTYSWSTGSTNASIPYVAYGLTTLTVMGTNTVTGCTKTNTLNVNTYAAGLVSINGNTAVCSGLSGVFTATGSHFYLWNNGTTGNTNTITPTGPTIVNVVGTTLDGCKDSTSLAVVVTGNLNILVTGLDTICVGQSTTLIANALGATSYSWSTGAVTQSITVSPVNTNSYNVTAFNANCNGSKIHEVVVKSLPNVSFNLSTPLCSNTGFYAMNGTPAGGVYTGLGVSGNTFDTGVGLGNYSITYQVTGSYGCTSSIMQTLSLLSCVGIDEQLINNHFTVYPNPTQGKITVNVNRNLKSILIFDYTGRLVNIFEYTNTQQTEIDLSQLMSGIYTLMISTANGGFKAVKVVSSGSK